MRAASPLLLAIPLLSALAAPATPAHRRADVPAALDTAIARMGGLAALQKIERARLEVVTQWQRIHFEDRPYGDYPSYEVQVELRDYAVGGWRNARRSPSSGPQQGRIDVVRDSVSVIGFGTPTAWRPLSLAYVDERDEVFTFAPERVLVLARAATDLKALPDTAIAGVPHARVRGTVGRFPATLFFRRGDGFLAMARWTGAHPADFGLVPWGEMEVELWYSNWSKHPSGIAYPRQWDVRRVGKPYKRLTVLSAAFDLPAMPDSFAISDSLRQAYHATADRPMHDVPYDSARIVEGRFAVFGANGAPAGAVKLGRQWVLVEAGQAPLSVERATSWLSRAEPGAAVAAAVVTPPLPGNGGAAWLAQRKIPVHVGPGVAPYMQVVLRNHGAPAAGAAAVTRGRWLRVDGDSLWMEPLDLPNATGGLLVYVPSLRWAYTAMAALPLEMERVRAVIAQRGWTVERIGSQRAFVPAPASAQAGR